MRHWTASSALARCALPCIVQSQSYHVLWHPIRLVRVRQLPVVVSHGFDVLQGGSKGVPRRFTPILKGVREEVVDGIYALVRLSRILGGNVIEF